jgi:hypothetical protein
LLDESMEPAYIGPGFLVVVCQQNYQYLHQYYNPVSGTGSGSAMH